MPGHNEMAGEITPEEVADSLRSGVAVFPMTEKWAALGDHVWIYVQDDFGGAYILKVWRARPALDIRPPTKAAKPKKPKKKRGRK